LLKLKYANFSTKAVVIPHSSKATRPCSSSKNERDEFVELLEVIEMVMSGDNVSMRMDLIASLGMGQGLRISIREGRRTDDASEVVKINGSSIIVKGA
jgi:hypothetical protein